jgi:hypothetical protein
VYSLGPAGVDELKENPLSSGEKTRVAPSDSEWNENRKSALLDGTLSWKGGDKGTSPEIFAGPETGADAYGSFAPADPVLFTSKVLVVRRSGSSALGILLLTSTPSKRWVSDRGSDDSDAGAAPSLAPAKGVQPAEESAFAGPNSLVNSPVCFASLAVGGGKSETLADRSPSKGP